MSSHGDIGNEKWRRCSSSCVWILTICRFWCCYRRGPLVVGCQESQHCQCHIDLSHCWYVPWSAPRGACVLIFLYQKHCIQCIHVQDITHVRTCIHHLEHTHLVVGFNSGPNLKDVDFSVSCVKPSDPFDCTNPALNSASAPVTGVSRKKPSFIEVQVNGLVFNTTYGCYISAKVGRVTKCVGPTTGSTLAPQWVLGQLGESCDQACSQTGRICNQEPQRDIVTLDQYSFVANLLDVQVNANTFNCGGISCTFPEIPGFQPGLNGINSGVSNCAGSRNSVQRFCCCGASALCPVSWDYVACQSTRACRTV